MPQIANQDYNFVAPRIAGRVQDDAYALGKIRSAIEMGTLFDLVVRNGNSIFRPCAYDFEPEISYYRVIYLGFDSGYKALYLALQYSASQYSFLDEVQEKEFTLGLTQIIPALSVDKNKYLADNNTSVYICTEGGNYILASVDDGSGRFASFEDSGVKCPDGVNKVEVNLSDVNVMVGAAVV